MVHAPAPFLMRPTVLEYTVTGRLDGVTLAPSMALPPGAESPLDSGGFVQQTVENLGLIDLARAGGPAGQYAGRFVKWIEIVGPTPPFAFDSVGIAFDGQLTRGELRIPTNANGIYSRNCIFVPQTAQLYLNGMQASAEPVVVRIALWKPRSLEELTAIIETCCCKGGCVNDLDEPCFTQAVYSPAAGDRTLTGIDPAAASRGVQSVHTVTGTGFRSDDSVMMRRIIPLPVFDPSTQQADYIHVDSFVVINPTTATLTITPGADLTLGTYDLILSPALGSSVLAVGLEDAINLT